MEHFNNFQNMEQYFKNHDNIINNISSREKELKEQECILLEQSKIQEHEHKARLTGLNKLEKKLIDIDTKNKKRLKEHELKTIQKIEKHNLKLELDNTGYILCEGHRHKSVRTYTKCNHSKKDYNDVTNLVYFTDIQDDNFNDKIDELFEMFVEQLQDNTPIIRYNKYKQSSEKINYICNKVSTKQTKYKSVLRKMRKRYNITDMYGHSESSNSEENKSKNNSDSDFSESDSSNTSNSSPSVKIKQKTVKPKNNSDSDFSDDVSISDSDSNS